jgi:hypothetical protein
LGEWLIVKGAGVKLQVFLFMIIGMIVAYGLIFALSDLGLILFGGGAFGLLLYIAISISKKQSTQN